MPQHITPYQKAPEAWLRFRVINLIRNYYGFSCIAIKISINEANAQSKDASSPNNGANASLHRHSDIPFNQRGERHSE